MYTFPTTTWPSFDDSSMEEEARVTETKFGDGYRQRAADGINNVVDAWSLVWKNITLSEANTIIDFFRARAGYDAFWWTPPGETSAKKWTCQKWSKVPHTALYATVKASFRREFDLG